MKKEIIFRIVAHRKSVYLVPFKHCPNYFHTLLLFSNAAINCCSIRGNEGAAACTGMAAPPKPSLFSLAAFLCWHECLHWSCRRARLSRRPHVRHRCTYLSAPLSHQTGQSGGSGFWITAFCSGCFPSSHLNRPLHWKQPGLPGWRPCKFKAQFGAHLWQTLFNLCWLGFTLWDWRTCVLHAECCKKSISSSEARLVHRPSSDPTSPDGLLWVVQEIFSGFRRRWKTLLVG